MALGFVSGCVNGRSDQHSDADSSSRAADALRDQQQRLIQPLIDQLDQAESGSCMGGCGAPLQADSSA